MSLDTSKLLVGVDYEGVNFQLPQPTEYIIITAELPNTTFELSYGGSVIDTKVTDSTTGGKVLFYVDNTGTYTLTAKDSNNTQLWTNTVTVIDKGSYLVKTTKTLSQYTYANWHTALQGGYFSAMFNLADTFTLSASGNILNGYKFFVEEIEQVGSKEVAHIRMANRYTAANYAMNQKVYFVTSVSDSSWKSKDGINYGGFKHSDLIKKFMSQGTAIYSVATSILPNNYSGSLTNGVIFNDLKYTDGTQCGIYSYNSTLDTFTQLSDCVLAYPSTSSTMYIKGYFKSVGTIDEATFNAGVYYTYNGIYTKATVYSNLTTYYGLYETLQENGIFYDALLNSSIGSYLYKFTENASTGYTGSAMIIPTVTSYETWADIPALEELLNVNRSTTLMCEQVGSQLNGSVDNAPGEGVYKNTYNFNTLVCTGEGYLTRSACWVSSDAQFQNMYNRGYSGTTWASGTYHGVKLGFRLQ